MTDPKTASAPRLRRGRFPALAVALALVFIIIGSLVNASTGPAVDDWYTGLNKSSVNPPGWLFGVVWPILYALIGVSTAMIWMSRERRAARVALVVMGLQMVLNYAWSFVFFGFHMVDLAFWWILLVAFWVLILIPLVWRFKPIAAALLLPYAAWLGFAGYLAGTIMVLN